MITTNRKEIIRFSKPIKQVKIGDPYYFEMMEKNKEKYLKDVTCDFKTSACKVSAISVEHKGFDWDEIEVLLVTAADTQKVDTYLEGKWYGEDSCKKEYELGCDTASFEITINGNYDYFNTGSDGYYAHVYQLKQYYGTIINLNFDASLFDFEEIKKRMIALMQ